jgi:hypothetical protein
MGDSWSVWGEIHVEVGNCPSSIYRPSLPYIDTEAGKQNRTSAEGEEELLG